MMVEARGGDTDNETVLTTAECHIMIYKSLQFDPNKVWTRNHLRTFSNRSAKESHRPEAVEETLHPQVLHHNQRTARSKSVDTSEANGAAKRSPLKGSRLQ
jgi:hypothetical protein